MKPGVVLTVIGWSILDRLLAAAMGNSVGPGSIVGGSISLRKLALAVLLAFIEATIIHVARRIDLSALSVREAIEPLSIVLLLALMDLVLALTLALTFMETSFVSVSVRHREGTVTVWLAVLLFTDVGVVFDRLDFSCV